MITTIFDPNVILTPIEMYYKKNIRPDSVLDYVQNIGKKPFIIFREQVIEHKDVYFFKLNNDSLFPTIDMIFKDPLSQFFDTLYPIDSETISLFIKSRSKNTKSIRIDFIITDFVVLKNDSGNKEEKIYNLKGKINFRDFVVRSYKGSSYETLQYLAKESNLGFGSNITSTNDVMTWINKGYHMSEFLTDISLCSYKSDDTFLWTYIDEHYYLNYVDIESLLNEDISKQICNTADIYVSNDIINKPLILTNNPDFNGSNLYIDKYRIDNNSYSVNWDLGYNSVLYYYDKLNKNINIFELDTISTVGKKSNLIIEKGIPTDNIYKKINRRNYYIGKMDTDNMHENYMYAYQQNVNNIKFLDKIRMVIVLKNINSEIRRYQLINVELYNLGKPDGDNRNESGESGAQQVGDRSNKINQRLSGEWLITGINYILEDNDYYQEIILVKRELTAVYKNIVQVK